MHLTESPSDLSSQVAANVRAALARRRISARKVAEEAGWTQSYLARRMSGAAAFNVADLEKLADLLGLSVESLVATERAA